MTREETITVFEAFMDNPLFSDVHKAAFNIAIHDIKQRNEWDINHLILVNKDNYEPLEQEPRKGHWVLTDVEGNKVWHCHCSECDKDPQDYVGGSEDWWLIKSKLPKFCPSCGSDNREVEE